jgi:hypothetical protein
MWAATETAVIIIGVSIPYLRRLLRYVTPWKKPKSKGYTSHTTRDVDEWRNTMTARKPDLYDMELEDRKGDDMSDKIILSEEKATHGGIMVTRHITSELGRADTRRESPSAVWDRNLD